jgi:hypothetical protein
MAVWLYGCMAVWLYGCMAVWLYGCLVSVAQLQHVTTQAGGLASLLTHAQSTTMFQIVRSNAQRLIDG